MLAPPRRRRVAACLSLLAVAASGFAPRGRQLSSAARGPAAAAAPARRVAVASSFGDYGDETPPELQKNAPDNFVYVGNMVQAQDEYEQWYVAEIVELRETPSGTEAAVKYLGWEDWPIEWLPTSRLGYMPKVRPPVPDEMLPPKVLAQKLESERREKAMWQCQKFREAFGGSYDVAVGERYALKDGALALAGTFDGELAIDNADDASAPTAYDGWGVRIAETRTGIDDALPMVEKLQPGSFESTPPPAGAFGAVGGVAANCEAFSCARAGPDRLAAEVWMAASGRVMQLRVVYDKAGDAWAFAHCDVARYAADGLDAGAAGEAGSGIFDVHKRLSKAAARALVDGAGPGVLELNLPGFATAAFLATLDGDGAGCVSLDWTPPGSEMRVQVDRVFDAADGSVASLEITDVLASEAWKYSGVHSN